MAWAELAKPKVFLSVLIGSALGAGMFPIAPGTMGALVGIPLAYGTQDWFWVWRVAFWVGLTWVGTWAAKVFDQSMGTSDNQNIVIDEVIGLGITAWTAGQDPKTWAAAFVAFRFFDILKPPPVRQVDSWSKKNASPWKTGFGVIADDLVAGFQGLVLIVFCQWLGIL
jgi:phosphatidylglycerophosphatase A